MNYSCCSEGGEDRKGGGDKGRERIEGIWKREDEEDRGRESGMYWAEEGCWRG